MKFNVIILFTLFCSLFTTILNAQSRIVGSDVIQEECCELYTVTLTDSLDYLGVWTICDDRGNALDQRTTTGRISPNGVRFHEIEICPSDLKNNNGVLIIKFEIDDLQLMLEKRVFIEPNFIEIISSYDCLIDSKNGCDIVCEGSSALYTVESNGTGVVWSVSGGEIIRDNGREVLVKWDRPGKGYVQVEDFNSRCSTIAFLCVEVLAKPEAAFTTIPNYDNQREITICKGQTVYFEDESIDALNLEWYFGNGLSDTKSTVNYTYETPGVYIASLITDNGCACIDTSFVTITVEDSPAPVLTCIGTTCPGESNTYYVESPCNEIVWTVSPNGAILDGGALTDDFITVNWNNGPEGTITVLGQNCPAGYCTEPSIFKIPVLSTDGPIEGDATVCYGQKVQYSAPYFQGTEYNWMSSVGGRIISPNGSQTITIVWDNVTAPNANQWVEVVYDNCYLECGGQDRLNVNVLGQFVIVGGPAFCEDDNITFEAKNASSPSLVNATWRVLSEANVELFSAPASAVNINESLNLAPGTYIIEATVDATQYCDDVLRESFTIEAKPQVPDGVLTLDEVCVNTNHHFEVDNLQSQYAVLWEITDGTDVYTFENTSVLDFQFKSTGPYSVSVMYQDYSGLHCLSDKVTKNLIGLQFNIVGGNNSCFETTESYATDNSRDAFHFWSIVPPTAGVVVSGQGSDKVEIFWAEEGAHQVEVEHCAHSAQFNVTVQPAVLPQVNAPVGLCEGELAAISLTQAYSHVEWFDDAGTSISNTATVNLGSGYYNVRVEDAYGCIGEEQFFIDEYGLPDAVISISELRAFCEPEPFNARTLFATTTGDYTFQWFFNGIPLGANQPTLDATLYGPYNCLITSKHGCEKMSNTIFIINECDPSASGGGSGQCNRTTCPPGDIVNFDVIDDPFYCNTKTFRNASLANVININWIFEDLSNGGGWSTNSDWIPTHTFKTAGYHTVIMDVFINPISNPATTCQTHTIQIIEIPVAARFNAGLSCEGDTHVFEDLSTFLPNQSITSYSWDFDDPTSGALNNSNSQHPNHVFSQSGKYNVTLTIEAASGCSSVFTQEVTVVDNPLADFTLPAELCVGASLEVNAPVGLFDVTWDFDEPTSGGANSATSATAFHAFSAAGNYDITLTVHNIYGCEAVVTKPMKIVDAGANEVITVNGSLPLCEGEQISLTAPTGVNWVWSNGVTTRTVIVGETGDYSVIVETTEGCIYETSPVTVTVNPLPNVIAIAHQTGTDGSYLKTSAIKLDVCANETALLEALTAANVTYRWSNNRGGQTNAIPTWSTGVTNYNVVVTDLVTGCVNTSNDIIVEVHAIPAQPFITESKAGPHCEGDALTLSISNFDAQYNYVWNTGETSQTITASSAGDYFVNVYNQIGCNRTSQKIVIHRAPDADLVMSGCFVRCDPDTICLPDFQDVASYQWYKDGQPINTPLGQSKDFIATESGVYNLELTSSYGCSDISEDLTLEITPSFGDLKVTVWYDTNGNGIIDAGDTVVEDIQVDLTDPNNDLTNDQTSNVGEVNWYDIIGGKYTAGITSGKYKIVIGTDSVIISGCGKFFEINLLVDDICAPDEVVIDTLICLIDTIRIGNLEITEAGIYQVMEQTTEGCDSIITINVDTFPAIRFALDTTLCEKDLFTWKGVDYTDAGTYSIRDTTPNGCLTILDIEVTYRPEENDVIAGVYLDSNNDGVYDAGDVAWSDMLLTIEDGTYSETLLSGTNGKVIFEDLISSNYRISFDSTLLGPEYEVVIWEDEAEVEGCTDQKEVFLLIRVVTTEIYIPNVFTPNGDENNDEFRIFTAQEDDQIQYFAIYNRWGELLFEDKNLQDVPLAKWDGRFRGDEVEPGVFVYVVDVVTFTGELKKFIGDVTLVR